MKIHRQIGKLTVVPQRFFCGENTETHGIRLDVYLDEENGEIFDIELKSIEFIELILEI